MDNSWLTNHSRKVKVSEIREIKWLDIFLQALKEITLWRLCCEEFFGHACDGC